MSDEIPRRIRLDFNTPAELAIRAAVDAVEALPADVRLTDAVVLLQQARERVAAFVDNVPQANTEGDPPQTPIPYDTEHEGTIAWLRGAGYIDAANALAYLHAEDKALRSGRRLREVLAEGDPPTPRSRQLPAS